MSTRPIPGDPAGPKIESMMDIRHEDWWISQTGDINTAAVETMRVDGSQFQRVIAIEIPVRKNHQTELETLRLMIHPESAISLAENLAHTGAWLLEHARRERS